MNQYKNARRSHRVASVIFALASGSVAWGQGAPQGSMTWHHEYDANGNLQLVLGPLGAQTDQDHDALNRLGKVTQPQPLAGVARPIVELGYNGQDGLTSVSDPRKKNTTYQLNGLGNISPLTSPDTGATTYTYYDDGNVKSATDARGKLTSYLYDGLNRLTKATYAQGVASRYFYDGSEQQVPAPFSQGRLTQITDESGSTKLGYDAYGHVLTKKQVTGDRTFNVSYTYGDTGTSNGKLADLRYPSQAVVHYTYDALTGQISGITVNPVKANGSGTNTNVTLKLLTDLKYTAWNEPSGWIWADGVVYSRAWDGYARPSTYPIGNPSGTGKAAGMMRTVGYDDAGRILTYTHADGANRPLPAWDQSFVHDRLDRITQATGSGTSYGYDYDANGNRKRFDVGSQSYLNVMKTDSNRIDTEQAIGPGGTKTKYTLAFDDAGHMTSGAGFTATYSARGRMASLTKSGLTTSYLYNGLEQRVYKAGSAVPTGAAYFVYDEQGRVLGEYDATGAPHYEVIWLGDQPMGVIHQTRSGTPPNVTISTRVDFVYADHLNAPRAIARPSDHAIVWRWDSIEPFGLNLANDNPNSLGPYAFNLRLPGQEYDAESSLHHNGYRDFDPWTGRYLQSDPKGLRAGINTYTYVRSGPLTRVDPTGLLDVFIGGAMDGSSGIVSTYQKQYQKSYPERSSRYFEWDQGGEAVDAIKATKGKKKCEPINIIGHSYGGSTAASISRELKAAGINVALLVTIDPVSRIWSRGAGAAEVWVNVNAAPTTSNGFSGDRWAALGGKWDDWPAGIADSYYEAPFHHNQFADMLEYETPDGRSALEDLLESESTDESCSCERSE